MAFDEQQTPVLLTTAARTSRPLPSISDATLRDSAHMAGVEFNAADTVAVAQLLVKTGVELVEVGMISGGKSGDQHMIDAVHEAIGPERSMSLVMVRDRQQTQAALAEARRLGVRHVMFSIPTSVEHAELKLASPSQKYLFTLAAAAIDMAKEHGFHVTFSGEDGARTERSRLVDYVANGFAAGGDRFRLAETVAYLAPWQMYDTIKDIVAVDGAQIEIHSHNMLGMATANSLAAYEAGAEWISVTAGGIGERGGNAPLAEVLTSLRVVYGDERFDLTNLTALTEAALAGSGLGDSFMSGPTTPHAFAYELPGQLTHPSAYETLPPEVVGNTRELRVRTRFGKPLLKWALGGDVRPGFDLDAFTEWLSAKQDADGRPLLDREAIRAHAAAFAG